VLTLVLPYGVTPKFLQCLRKSLIFALNLRNLPGRLRTTDAGASAIPKVHLPPLPSCFDGR
jgi:hypothetical protein